MASHVCLIFIHYFRFSFEWEVFKNPTIIWFELSPQVQQRFQIQQLFTVNDHAVKQISYFPFKNLQKFHKTFPIFFTLPVCTFLNNFTKFDLNMIFQLYPLWIGNLFHDTQSTTKPNQFKCFEKKKKKEGGFCPFSFACLFVFVCLFFRIFKNFTTWLEPIIYFRFKFSMMRLMPQPSPANIIVLQIAIINHNTNGPSSSSFDTFK